ncbi:molybdopterin molybdotransferase MoeA [Sphingobium boeckii]|uniref:Molybdopterin molybdenumtransferase n=1 Tax=Sphingobium boeckii TaxID=1082345 RepID=A0A7W9AGN1_9SPHN|nr:gephyrin-like molybdotransferase Glp [Sphingobium boeckii]MBB5685089.1 molybdopterin molybdotransferase [Sphingobium boeckii]
MSLLPVAEAQARLVALGRVLPAETVSLEQGTGRWAARAHQAQRNQPAADLSAMDGYAIRFADLPGPWRVIGESTPGTLPDLSLSPGEAVRIFTGAALPDGADAILIQEEATRDGDSLTLSGEGPRQSGQHVRRAGSDFMLGETVIAQGAQINAARIAIAALSGNGRVMVGGRPRVALISTGDELVHHEQDAQGVNIPASNAPMLRALMTPSGAIIEDHGIVRDDFETLAAAFRAAKDADIIVTTGGASVGDHDLVRPVLQSLGAAMDFWKIAMKPGKPLMAGTLGDSVVLGLPGNPVSAYVTATLFLLPLIRAMSGAAEPLPPLHHGRLGHPLPAGGPRAEYLRAIWRAGDVVTATDQDSAAVLSLAAANALIVRAAHAPAAPAGETVDVISLT